MLTDTSEPYFVLDSGTRAAVSGWLPIPRNADDSSENRDQPESLEIVLDVPDEADIHEEIDESLYDDSGLPPIPDIEFSEPQDPVEFEVSEVEEVPKPKEPSPPDPEDLKSLRRLIHHLGRLTIEVQMIRVQEQEAGSCMANELAEAEEAMRQAVEELVQIKHHWGSGV